jgi:acetyltransferase
MGVMVPQHHFNASYGHLPADPGRVAYVGQSGILGCATLDWAKGHGLGFSCFTTLGDSVDVDMSDVIDYLADDDETEAILIQLERVLEPCKLISSLHAASRRKIVIAVKSGKFPASLQEKDRTPPGLFSREAIFNEVFHRVGVLRVESDALFESLETVTRMGRNRGGRLAVVSNGYGTGVLASDALLSAGGSLAFLSGDTRDKLDELLPLWNRANPVDLNANAGPERYREALEILVNDPGVDAVLVMYVPTLAGQPEAVAEVIADVAQSSYKSIIANFLGAASVGDAIRLLEQRGVPTFHRPEKAVSAFMHRVQYEQNQELLLRTPTPPSHQLEAHRDVVHDLVENALKRRRSYLTRRETEQALSAYGFDCANSRFAKDPQEAAKVAEEMGFPVALKVLTDVHAHPFLYTVRANGSWRGVVFRLDTAPRVERTAERLAEKAKMLFEPLQIEGFGLQPMLTSAGGLLISFGITRDPVFGPIIVFGEGGSMSNTMADRQVALPPLNMVLAENLVRRSRIYAAIRELFANPDEQLQTLYQLLVKLGQLVIEVPEIRWLECNPILMNREGIKILDAAIDLGEPAKSSISPYPAELMETVILKRSGKTVLLRPIRGEDEPAHQAFVARLSPQAIRFRFFHTRTSISHKEMARLTQVDYEREMAFIASHTDADGNEQTLGVVRGWTDPDFIRTEFAVVVRDDLRGEGLGSMLVDKMKRYAKSRGVLELSGTVLPENNAMLRLAERMGFACHYDQKERVMVIGLPLNPAKDDWQRRRLGLIQD